MTQTSILHTIQVNLQQTYDVSVPYNVNQFVCHNAKPLQAACGANSSSPEMLYYRQDGDNLDISLYLDSTLLERVDTTQHNEWQGELFNDYCMLLEGVSHFLYLTWNAHYNRQLSLLDIELQAEVDKFVLAMLDSESDTTQSSATRLIERLYEKISYRHDLTPSLQRRYEQANKLAHLYCSWLKENFSMHLPNRKLAAELARFYRLNGSAKQRHIKQLMH